MTNLNEPHTAKVLDRELAELLKLIARIGGMAENQIEEASRALLERDDRLAAEVIKRDQEVDRLEADIQQKILHMLALRAPVADDLRLVVSAISAASAFERVADYAANAAKRSMVLNTMPLVPAARPVVRLMQMVKRQLHAATNAFVEGDAQQAIAVWEHDDEIDAIYSSLFREILTYMMEDPRQISACAHLLFIAKNVERVGDHSTNIAELTYFMVTGKQLRDRPKADVTSSLGYSLDDEADV
ncbi:phosphate signaling complex protein PhoU [Oleispirillum naphthae]|uniref:phosphate signaling complex protein PhoU n=1 Tax=Oleispirillum naphthae TaxID=2838853 RepID=UPI0030822762